MPTQRQTTFSKEELQAAVVAGVRDAEVIDRLDRIEVQTTATNGRVGKIERQFQYAKGFFGCLAMVVAALGGQALGWFH